MTHERSDRIRLANDMARCEPSKATGSAYGCARYKAAIPAHGGSVADFSLSAGCHPLCAGFVSINAPQAEVPKQAPRVFKGF